jgi:hypothetical protein
MTTTPPTPETTDRNPLRTVAKNVSIVVGMISTFVTSAVGFGVVTAVQGNALIGLFGILPGLLTAVGTALAAFTTAQAGEQHVTPLVDPRNDAGVRLVPDASPFHTP